MPLVLGFAGCSLNNHGLHSLSRVWAACRGRYSRSLVTVEELERPGWALNELLQKQTHKEE